MNPIPTTPTTPIIKIGIVQSTQKVCFSCSGDFHLEHISSNSKRTEKSGSSFEATIVSSTPAKLSYCIRVALCKDVSTAEDVCRKFNEQGFRATARIVGMEIQCAELSVDNREAWITIGEFDSKEGARKFMQANNLPEDAKIVETILQPATGVISINGKTYTDNVRVSPISEQALVEVDEVPIGIQFHWQRTERLQYHGAITISFNNSGELVVINEVDLENYLASVNSSEMTPDCPLGLLQAQTVAARSTVLATMGKHHYNTNFHLCSDDHCQCYQGAKREQEVSQQAIRDTYGEILMYGTEVCDARYSKICGGIMESYPNVWEDIDIPYLIEGIDSEHAIEFPADTEEAAKRLIDAEPDVFCNTALYPLPSKLANLYSTKNLFRWVVTYSREDVEKLIAEKLGDDIGELQDIVPLSRGVSGRLIYIELVGSKKHIRIGKELEIRRIFSRSHLYSSAFYIEKDVDSDGHIKQITLKGAGWGHGVGLCQVGATVMAIKGYKYEDILTHYFKNTTLKKLYHL